MHTRLFDRTAGTLERTHDAARLPVLYAHTGVAETSAEQLNRERRKGSRFEK